MPRLLSLPAEGSASFFLWGPRQTGKSTLLREAYPDAFRVDLLLPEQYRRYLEQPQLLIDEVRLAGHHFIIIDEIQKVPALLDAVHWLHENEGVEFALCGSSARKVGGARRTCWAAAGSPSSSSVFPPRSSGTP